jgi:hypothetical protein
MLVAPLPSIQSVVKRLWLVEGATVEKPTRSLLPRPRCRRSSYAGELVFTPPETIDDAAESWFQMCH